MKSLITFIALFNLSLNTTQIKESKKSEFLEEKFEKTKEVLSSWKDSKYKYDFKFKINDKFYNLFKVKKNNEYKGYFILNEIGELESFYSGNCENINFSDIQSISPIFSYGSDLAEESENNVNLISSQNIYFVPPVLNVDLYKSSSSSFHSEQLITECPYYFNYPYSPIEEGCAPTTAAMLISFYDRYSELDKLLEKELPLNHEDDKENVNKLIVELATLMGTNTLTMGTYTSQIISGYNQYLTNKGYYGFQARTVYLYDDYSYIINTLKNPAHLHIRTTTDSDHSVLGVGTATVRQSGRFMITHYNWVDQNLGDYYVAEKYFRECYYIGS